MSRDVLTDAVKQRVKTGLRRTLPRLYSTLSATRSRAFSEQCERDLGLHRLAAEFIRAHGLSVQAGPFAGMRYTPAAARRHVIPKLLGCYEEELHAAVETLIARNHDAILDVGCAEGYYAAGMALRAPRARVVAFDTDPAARRLCAGMAQLNAVADRVTVRGACSASMLCDMVTAHSLLICDCEGYEMELLRPDLAPGLRACDILVELHDCFQPGLSDAVVARFRATHEICLIETRNRNPDLYPALALFDASDRALAVGEFRIDQMRWAVMISRGAP